VFVEVIVAFLLIVSAALFIYILGRRASPKPAQSESERSEYACGERAPVQKIKINITLYRYLIYFAIFDSSVLLLAFSALSGGVNVPFLILYLFIMLASSLVLLEGGKDQYE
jgi:NADH:ubiquinone oxidoreductase subunit 3 (subunit A)